MDQTYGQLQKKQQPDVKNDDIVYTAVSLVASKRYKLNVSSFCSVWKQNCKTSMNFHTMVTCTCS